MIFRRSSNGPHDVHTYYHSGPTLDPLWTDWKQRESGVKAPVVSEANLEHFFFVISFVLAAPYVPICLAPKANGVDDPSAPRIVDNVVLKLFHFYPSQMDTNRTQRVLTSSSGAFTWFALRSDAVGMMLVVLIFLNFAKADRYHTCRRKK